ncbi:MAG: restriction endonuclease [Acidimicrobiia bacterium]
MGGDEGIDGVIRFYIDGKEWGTALVSVKGGDALNPSMVRDLVGTVKKDRADMGILITRTNPTKGMYETATKDGFYTWQHGTSYERRFPRIQILSVEELLRGVIANLPPIHGTYAEAPKVTKGQGEQLELG